MLIGIDASRAVVAEATGTEVYSQELIRALLRLGEEANFRLYFNCPPSPGLFPDGANWEAVVRSWPRLWTHLRLGWEVVRHPPDVLFIPSHVLPVLHPARSVVTVHDLGYLYHPWAHPLASRLYLDYATRYGAHSASHLITLSQNTRQDLAERYGVPPGKVTVVYPGCGVQFRPVEDAGRIASVKAKYAIEGDYLLYVGRIQPRKNLARLLTAFWLFGERKGRGPVLVLAGTKGWLAGEILGRLRELDLEDGVHLTGYVPKEDLPPLYGGALAFLFPSLYEGFGFPLVEAMACGVPVMASDASSLPEVAGGAALLVDPLDVEAMAAGIERVLEDEELRGELVAKGLARAEEFSWEKCARETLAVLARVAQDGGE